MAAVRVVRNRKKALPYSVYMDDRANGKLDLIAGFTAGGDAHQYAAVVVARLRSQGQDVHLVAAP